MEEITSVNNSKIKEIVKLHQKKYRDESNFFLVEGAKAIEEINNAKIEIEQIFVLKNSSWKLKFPENKVTVVNEAVMKKLSTTESIAEIITLAFKPKTDLVNVKKAKKIALFENIKDAGNLGTIIRSAAAFEVEAILLFGDTVDIYNPKVIRSSASNFFKLPILKISDINVLKTELKDFKIISTGLKSKNNITFNDIKLFDKSLIMFGSEADGLSNELLKLADYNLILDINKNVESLNLAVASSIIFYELNKA